MDFTTKDFISENFDFKQFFKKFSIDFYNVENEEYVNKFNESFEILKIDTDKSTITIKYSEDVVNGNIYFADTYRKLPRRTYTEIFTLQLFLNDDYSLDFYLKK